MRLRIIIITVAYFTYWVVSHLWLKPFSNNNRLCTSIVIRPVFFQNRCETDSVIEILPIDVFMRINMITVEYFAYKEVVSHLYSKSVSKGRMVSLAQGLSQQGVWVSCGLPGL